MTMTKEEMQELIRSQWEQSHAMIEHDFEEFVMGLFRRYAPNCPEGVDDDTWSECVMRTLWNANWINELAYLSQIVDGKPRATAK